MTEYIQETDFRTVYPSSHKHHYVTAALPDDKTLGAAYAVNYFPRPLGSDVLSSARDLLHQLSGNAIARQARLLLAFLQGALSSIREVEAAAAAQS